ncbi:hypothetical protein PILCRDRAFT_175297 [Piloderma croceum F 1598]|uniref:Uncharacterized protein n=1 Tax=Piloderma croceum (strain F 1598) TaxID=765440 RepID=A0A0C3GEU5_PILCF|nr:hypothetical protein PILCRDRAFT_175297 [Piloderma croceum F 1598]
MSLNCGKAASTEPICIPKTVSEIPRNHSHLLQHRRCEFRQYQYLLKLSTKFASCRSRALKCTKV